MPAVAQPEDTDSRATRRSAAPRRTTLLVLVTGMVITVSTTAVVYQVQETAEQELIEQRHAGGKQLLLAAAHELMMPLQSATEALRGAGGDPAAFEHAVAPVLGPRGQGYGVALLQAEPPGDPRVLQRLGPPLALDRVPAAMASLRSLTPADKPGIVDLLDSPLGRRLGVAWHVPGDRPDLIVYGELPLRPPGTPIRATDGAFSDVDYALYLGTTERTEAMILGTVTGPLTGRRVASQIRFGSAEALLVVAPRTYLGGPLAAALPALVLVAGVLMVSTGALATEIIGRRGETAIRLGRDLTTRAIELAQAEQRYRSLVECMPAVTYVLDVDGAAVRYMSPQIEALSGVPAEAWERGRVRWLDLVHPEDRPDVLRWRDAAFSSSPSVSREYRLVRPDGEVLWVREVAVELPTAYGQARMVQAVMSDITELKRAQEALSSERDMSEALMDSLPGVFVLYDAQGRFRRWNRNFEVVTGYDAEETAELTPMDLVVESQRELVARRLTEGFERGATEVEVELVLKGGATIPYYFSGQLITLPQGPCLLGVGIDVTERRRAERVINELNATLEQRVQERTAELTVANRELDSFAYAVSHDLRGPLRAIDGFSLALLEDAGDTLEPAARGHLERVRHATRRMSELIDDLLTLSRVTRAEMIREPVDLSALARSVIEQLRAADQHRCVDVRIADGIEAHGDRRLLRVVLENLLGNAWKFSKRRPRARISFGTVQQEGTTVYVVEDDGAGFDPEYADKLFEPFQRLHTAQEFEGTGIGLATVARIIHRHRGRVWAEGAVDRGARVSFTCEAHGRWTDERERTA
jgi:PAS domain S-box-containing protein